MKIRCQLSIALFLSAAGLFAQPAPNSVQNPGSNYITGLPNYGIAQGSVFIVYGKGLGPVSIVGATSLPFPSSLAGTSITVAVGTTTVTAYMVYTSAGQVAAILPSNTPTGSGTLTVTYNSNSGSTPIVVVASALGVLSQNETGTGPAVATHVDNTDITNTNTTYPGEEIVVYGTGLGPLPSGVSDASPAGAQGANIGGITVWLGGVQVPSGNIAYHGRNPSDPGLDQINIVIPSGATLGCSVSLVIQSGNYVSNTTTLAIASSRSACSDANGISFSSLSSSLGSSGTASIGTVSLTSATYSISIAGFSETETSVTGSASFERYTAAQLNQSAGAFSFPSIGSCTILIVYPSSGTTSPITATGLDAGASIGVMEPSGTTVSLLPNSTIGKGYYASATNAFSSLPAGTYSITGPGGADVGAFMASLKVPATLTWTNESTITANPINRANPLTLTWTGGDPTSYVVIIGFSENSVSSGTLGAEFFCVAPIAPGSFTIPAPVLLSLPASSGSNGIGLLELGAQAAAQQFTATGLTVGYVSAESASGSTVTWQ